MGAGLREFAFCGALAWTLPSWFIFSTSSPHQVSSVSVDLSHSLQLDRCLCTLLGSSHFAFQAFGHLWRPCSIQNTLEDSFSRPLAPSTAAVCGKSDVFGEWKIPDLLLIHSPWQLEIQRAFGWLISGLPSFHSCVLSSDWLRETMLILCLMHLVWVKNSSSSHFPLSNQTDVFHVSYLLSVFSHSVSELFLVVFRAILYQYLTICNSQLPSCPLVLSYLKYTRMYLYFLFRSSKVC